MYFQYISKTTSAGRKFAPVEGLSHDLVCTGSIYHVHFAWQVWHGQLSPRFEFNKLKSFSRVEIDQNHVDKRILGGKGFAVGRLKRHNFCPASALRNRCCIDTKRCSSGYTQPQVLRWFEAKFKELWAPNKKTKITLQQEESVRLLKVWVMTWSVPDRFIMSILRGRCGTVNYHPVLNLIN